MSNSIRRVDVLKQMEIRETASGKPLYFSIQFYTDKGELIILPNARTCGLKMNMRTHRKRGVQPIDREGAPYGHIYPVSIDNIREFNNLRVRI